MDMGVRAVLSEVVAAMPENLAADSADGPAQVRTSSLEAMELIVVLSMPQLQSCSKNLRDPLGCCVSLPQICGTFPFLVCEA